jgi:NTE family protein
MATTGDQRTELAEFLRSVELFSELSDEMRTDIAAAAEIVQLPAGAWLFREGDESDGLYVVWSGRLEVGVESMGPFKPLDVLGAGASFGELSLVTGDDRAASVRAIRDSEVFRVAVDRFSRLLAEDDRFAMALTRFLGRQVRGVRGSLPPVPRRPRVFSVVTLQPGLRPEVVADGLASTFRLFGRTAVLTDARVGHGDATALGRLLDRCERENHWVVLAASVDEAWCESCVRQSDRVLAVVSSSGQPPRHVPAGMQGCDLVVCHEGTMAGEAGVWRDRLVPRATYPIPVSDPDRAVARIARRLAARSTGLVLSGGGARGLAHVGVMAVLEQSGFAIDRFGATSMGALIAGLFAAGAKADDVRDVCRSELVDARPFTDYTVPRYGLIKARKAESMLFRLFDDTRIEELPSAMYCVSADLLTGQEVVHRDGRLAQAVRASMSIPGLLPPASVGGRLLVDGGILNNLPVDVMARDDEGPIIAVDVIRRLPADHAGPSGSPPRVVETLARSTALGSWRKAEENRARARLVVTPELTSVGLLEFRRIDEIIDAGRRAAEAAIGDWSDAFAGETVEIPGRT